MVKLELSEFLKPEAFGENKEIKGRFVNGGEMRKLKDMQGNEKEVFVIKVEFLQEDNTPVQKLWTPNRTSLRSLVEKYGNDTEKWADKDVELFLNEENVQGKLRKVMYARGKL